MLWKFRLSEVIYLVLSLIYVIFMSIGVYQLSQPSDVDPLVRQWQGLVLVFPLLVFLGIHIFFGVVEFILYFYYKDKNKIEANFAIISFSFYLIPFFIPFTDASWLDENTSFVISLFPLQVTAILIIVYAFFRQQKEV